MVKMSEQNLPYNYNTDYYFEFKTDDAICCYFGLHNQQYRTFFLNHYLKYGDFFIIILHNRVIVLI